MKILAIETSCDDTGVAILEIKNGKFMVLSNIISSQPIHQNYGGVFPMMAKREHQINLPIVLKKALKEGKLLNPNKQAPLARRTSRRSISNEKIKTIKKILEKENTLFDSLKEFLEKYKKPNVDFIAVTNGPGLEPCLHVGVNFAKALSYIWNLPVVPVNHIEAHVLVNFLHNKEITFPAISLVVSGGHTQLILMKKIGSYNIIGETRDDAAGECFDKAARILGLGYPGGPIISKIASETKESSMKLPSPMIHSKDYDFSFSGLKTAVLYETQGKELTKEYVGQICVALQDAISDVLIKKTLQAAKDYKAKTIILGGGVSANQQLRQQFELKTKSENINVIFPDAKLSTDNALMIAVAGYFNLNKKTSWQELSVDANLRVK